ncbi:LysR substrate-binding domain-containing protein [Comamonas sp. A7-5]|uniref:LysR substrate-binding domain-containing protein n=1 Tax=Comamonas sp. A7-5 TaxID=673549 RepID=UPI0031D8A4FB
MDPAGTGPTISVNSLSVGEPPQTICQAHDGHCATSTNLRIFQRNGSVKPLRASRRLGLLLAQGRLDTAVLFDGPGDSGLAMEAVVQEPLLLVGSAGSLDDRESYTIEDIAQLSLLLLSRPNGIREVLHTVWSENHIAPKIVAEVNAPSLLIDAVHSGLGYAILPACAMEDRLRAGDLEARPIASARFTRTVHIATSRVFAPTPAAEHVH